MQQHLIILLLIVGFDFVVFIRAARLVGIAGLFLERQGVHLVDDG